MSGVEVRPLSRLRTTGLPASAAAAVRARRPPGLRPPPPYTCSGDADHHDPRPRTPPSCSRSSCPPERLSRVHRRRRPAPRRAGRASRASGRARRRDAVLERHLGPGAVLDEAVEHLVQDAYREATRRAGHPAPDQRRRRGRPGRGGQAAHLQGDGPGPARGRARRLQALQLRARDRDHRRRPGRQGPRGAARPERDARRGRGPRRAGRRLRGHLVRRDRATASRSRAARSERMPLDPRPGAADPGLRGQPARPRGRRLHRVRHHLPRRLPRDRAGRQAGPLRGRAARAAREGPARARRRLRRDARRLRRPRRAAGRHQARASSATRSTGRATSFADRIIEYAVANATVELPRHPRRPGGRGDARRVPRLDRAPGHHRGGLPQGARQDRRRPPRRVPAGRREARPDPARPVQGRRRRGRRRPGRGGRCRGRPRPRALPGRRQAPGLLRHRSAAGPTSAARSAAAASSRGSSTSGSPTIPTIRRCRISRTRPPSAIEGEQAAANAAVDATDPGSILDDVPAAAG